MSKSFTSEQRADPKFAEQCLRDLIPVARQRTAILTGLADAIRIAHSLSPGTWGVSLLHDLVRLNVGRAEVLTITDDWFHLLIDPSKVPTQYTRRIWGDGYASVPRSRFIDLPLDQYTAWESLLPAWLPCVKKAAETPRNPMTRRAHSPGVLLLLREMGHSNVPNPLWAA